MKIIKYLMIAALLFALCIVYSYFTVSILTPSQTELREAIRHLPNDARYLVMVDFAKASAQERLYVYDLKEKDYVYSGVVQHGLGGKSTARRPEFSNVIGSRCSSLGLYRVAEYSHINRIKAFKIPCFRLDGLSSTNSNARARGLLIHTSVTASSLPFEIWGLSLPLTRESEGCFAVSRHTMKTISELKKKGNVYLYAYCNE